MNNLKTAMALTATVALVIDSGCSRMERIFYQPTGNRIVTPGIEPPPAAASRAGVARAQLVTVAFRANPARCWSNDTATALVKSDRASDSLRQVPPANPPTRPRAEDSERQPPTAQSDSAINQTQPKDKPKASPDAEKPVEAQPKSGAAQDESKDKPLPYTVPGVVYRGLQFASAVVIGMVETQGAGREVSESLIFSPEGATGQLGLTAPPATVDGVLVTRRGLQGGGSFALGKGTSNNIFQAQANPLSGPSGRCQDLTQAGHFGSVHACETTLGR